MAVYIALGSNLGDREGNLRRALELLREQGIRPVRVAPFVETKPYGVTDQPDFLNTVAAVETDLEPLDLLHALLATERQMGRVRLPLGRAEYRSGPAALRRPLPGHGGTCFAASGHAEP